MIEAIDVDVRRSFNKMKYLTHGSLSNMLKSYALINPRLNYCQGMNFMAGFLFLTMMPTQLADEQHFAVNQENGSEEQKAAVKEYKDELTKQAEWLAFNVMRETIARFNLEQLFNQELPMLKQMFYQLDRLISIYLPDLHNHFRDENINSSFYSSSFFITVFSSHV